MSIWDFRYLSLALQVCIQSNWNLMLKNLHLAISFFHSNQIIQNKHFGDPPNFHVFSNTQTVPSQEHILTNWGLLIPSSYKSIDNGLRYCCFFNKRCRSQHGFCASFWVLWCSFPSEQLPPCWIKFFRMCYKGAQLCSN